MLEDDFTLSGGKFSNDTACCCPKHLEWFGKEYGKKVTKEELRACLFSGEPNRKRYIWRKIQGQTLLNFAKEIEKTVHETDEKIQIAPSANSSSFDFEGVLFSELAKVLAGKNRPIARLTGAPYWKHTNTLAPNIEAIRLQASWCNGEIDVISEGDTYPRPRCWTPSAFLEGYDMVLRADGCCNGILRYMIDYNSSPQYETGYMDRYVKNQKYYKETEKRFSKGKSVGFNIFENPLLTEVRDYREIKFGEPGNNCELFPLSSQWLFSDNSIPTCYGMKNCPSVAFGENGHFLTDEQMKNGVMLDVVSAKILMSKGIDVGIESLERTENPKVEHFEAYNELTMCNLPERSIVYDMTVKDGTKILSEFIECSGGLGTFDYENLLNCKSYPSCVYYKNQKGMKFIIYSFVMDSVTTTCEWESGIFRNYCRQRQLADSYKYLSGEKLPAMCFGNPDLYILCKEVGNSLVVGLWNFFPDEVINPVIELSKVYSKIDFYNCQGSLEGDFVQLSKSIDPYGFAYFTVE